MQTLAVLARKGGVGKTTLCVHLAVLAQEEGQRVLLVDLDPQRSTAEWWAAREGDTPAVVQAEPARLVEVLKAARSDGYDLAIIDTPPSVAGDTAAVARLTDLVVIPTRPAILDLRAIRLTVDLVRTLKAPAVVLLNAVPASRGGSEAPITAEARRALAPCGLPVVPAAIGARAALAHALVDGRAVTEFELAGKAAGELRAIWRFLKGTMDGTEKARPTGRSSAGKERPGKGART